MNEPINCITVFILVNMMETHKYTAGRKGFKLMKA